MPLRRSGHRVRGKRFAELLLVLNVIPAAVVLAQAPGVNVEIRTDAFFARSQLLQVGGSVIVPAGVYARNSLTAAVGRSSGSDAVVPRLEITSRFLLDPLRESHYGLSIGGGVGAVHHDSSGPYARPYLVFLMDIELRKTAGWLPAVQVGLGDGARIGVSFRSASARWR
jgi:hypothetical protein